MAKKAAPQTDSQHAKTQPEATLVVVKRSRFRSLLSAAFWLIVVVVVYLVLAESPIDPIAYMPPPKPELTGSLAPNEALRGAEILAQGQIVGPEDVDVDEQGRIYGGTLDGKIVRIEPDGSVETFAETGGRPLGLEFDAQGNLIVCDGIKGLLSVDPDGKITTLATEADGVQLGFADDLDVGPEGVIYFSDASTKFDVQEYLLDFLEDRPHGRLLSYEPQTRQAKVLLRDLYFANGIAVSPDGDYVLVNETYRYRVTRYWLRGPNAGTWDTFAENLPGFPDGISTSPRGTFWVAMFTLRNDQADLLAPRPAVRRILSKLPQATWPKPEPYGLVLELNSAGEIVRSLHDPGGELVRVITSVHEQDGSLYMGTLLGEWVARLRVPPG